MRLLVSALEPSSNIHLREVLKYIKNVELLGIFDKSFGNPIHDVSNRAIMGVVDFTKRYLWFKAVAHQMVELAKDADKILLMDSSGFNLPLAKKIKNSYPNKEIIYYILPQVWASRPKRVNDMELYCDKILGILPFEIEYYRNKAKYVGHPLLDEIKVCSENREEIITFMPGSRKSEIGKLLPIYRKVRKRLANKRAVIVIPKSFSNEKIEEFYGDISEFEISKNTHETLAKSEFAFICSGTATLESALIGTPFVLSYIAKKLDFFIGKRIFGIEQIGLANIILNRYNGTTLHKELVQGDVTVENLLEEYRRVDRKLFKEKSNELKSYLGRGSSKEVAKIIIN